ncbi:hypothetical protein E2C01_061704 [Portunus trituberculatus]|uniref:Uncharacterized protein n=1 Tax=Portunus trituberculatus TaxID=210409 RepID=A0A5B7HDZ6_PORTR|nr:hypothetical protein [Portunus trituberculatus]
MFGLCGLGNGTVSTLYSLVALEAAGLEMQLPVLSLVGLVTAFWFLLVDPLTEVEIPVVKLDYETATHLEYLAL